MRRSSLFWRVLANFGFLLLVLSAMTLLTLYYLSEIERNFGGAAADTKTMMKVESITKLLTDVIFDIDLYITTGTASSRNAYIKDGGRLENELRDMAQIPYDTTIAQLFKDASWSFSKWRESYADKKIILADQKHTGISIERDLFALEAQESQNLYLTRLRSSLGDASRRLSLSQLHSFEGASSLGDKLGKFIGLVNILLAIFALLLGFFLTASITTPVKILKQGTQNIMKGEFTPIALKRSDELGQLAVDFNKMSQMLGNNYTRLQAYSELVTALNTHAEMAAVESRSLTLLCSHIHASVGALYLLNDPATTLNLVAGYALKNREHQVKSFTVGEGIPGQCAAEQRSIEVKNLPTNTAFSIDTGLVEVPPRFMLAVPIMFQDRLLGVIVVGSMEEFGALQKEIIDNSVPQIGVAIANARNYEATQKLSIEIAKKNDELNQKHAELEKAYRVKSDFLASMSHELRTPLNSIIGFSSVLLGPNNEPLTSDQGKAIEKILKNGKHLLQLINDILDLSKIEAGRMTVSVDTETVDNIVASSMLTVESLIRAKNLSLRQHIQTGIPALNTDSLKVKQILVNLLSNATKFTETGEISLSVKYADDALSFAVKDTGIGIDRKNLERIFEEFQQIDSSTTRKYSGTGLGLPIARRLARMLGGDLAVESEFGKGSVFTLAIPPVYRGEEEIKKEPVQAEPPLQEKQPQPAKQPQLPPQPPPLPPPPAKKEEAVPSAQPQAQGIPVLCIDDDPDVIDILRGYLAPEGYSVLKALSGDEGIAIAAKARPGLITLDIMMPNKDGWQVLRELKQNPLTRDIPVLIHSIIDNKPLALSLGAADVIPKPTDQKRLISLVKTHYRSLKPFVLIIDTNPGFIATAQGVMESAGFLQKNVASSKEALAIIEKSTPAVIFFDPLILEADGFQLAQRFKLNERWRMIPIVILSVKPTTKKVWEQWNLNIKGYMSKEAASPETIVTIIKRSLRPS
ncbi:MAG: response regulator [Bacteroidota bacterium]